MTEKNTARIVIGAMNLLAVTSPLTSQVAHASVGDHKIEQLNVASLKSIESTWIKVPNACKARGFHADAVSVKNQQISAHIQTIYAAYGV